MKKILSIIILGLLLTSASGFFIIESSAENGSNDFATHTVLGEYGTATWCGYCKYAHGALKELYKGGWHDFYYVSLVCDKNTHAYNRAINQLGLTGYPTVFWDGKYRTDVGAGSVPGAMAAYNASIIACANRAVANIDLIINATWLGGTQVSITVNVINNQGSTYNGYLRCYVTEIASSMGWYDTGGQLYTFPFLDYAFDQSISITAGGTWSNTVVWDGATHNDGYGHYFTSITQDNTFIIASVFSSSSPYYVDETAGFRVGSNRPPSTPSSPNPSNGSSNVPLTPTLSWQCTDPDWFDDLYFDVYFEKDDSTPDVLVSNNQTGTTYIPGTLDMESIYYWQIVVHDEYGLTVQGPIWHFTTRGNSPPNAPSNPNPANGSTNIPINPTLSWNCGDPDGDKVYYDVYFEAENPNPNILVSYNQTSKTYKPSQLEYNTTYYWKIVARDVFGEITEGPVWSFKTMEEPQYIPDLECSGIIQWSNVKTGSTVTSNFKVQNIGDPTSKLYWRIENYPEWGTWTFNPDHGDGLTPEDGFTTVQVSVVAPSDKNTEFTGEIKVININDPSDFKTIPVTLKTPRDKTTFINILEKILQRFPNAFPFLKIFFGI